MFDKKLRRLRRAKGTFGKCTSVVFAAGQLPSHTFGSEVHGLSSFERHKIQVAAANTRQPAAKPRSRTSALLLSEDPTWYPAVALIARYFKEVWANPTRQFPSVPS